MPLVKINLKSISVPEDFKPKSKEPLKESWVPNTIAQYRLEALKERLDLQKKLEEEIAYLKETIVAANTKGVKASTGKLGLSITKSSRTTVSWKSVGETLKKDLEVPDSIMDKIVEDNSKETISTKVQVVVLD